MGFQVVFVSRKQNKTKQNLSFLLRRGFSLQCWNHQACVKAAISAYCHALPSREEPERRQMAREQPKPSEWAVIAVNCGSYKTRARSTARRPVLMPRLASGGVRRCRCSPPSLLCFWSLPLGLAFHLKKASTTLWCCGLLHRWEPARADSFISCSLAHVTWSAMFSLVVKEVVRNEANNSYNEVI